MAERRALQNEVAQLRRDLAMGGKSGGPEVREIGGVRLIAQVLQGVSGKDLPALIDEMKQAVRVASAAGKMSDTWFNWGGSLASPYDEGGHAL